MGYKAGIHINLDSSHVFFVCPDARAAVGYKPVLGYNIFIRTFWGHKIGCFVFFVLRIHPQKYKEDPELAIIIIHFNYSNFSDNRIKLSSDQSAVGFLRYIALDTLHTYDTPTPSDTRVTHIHRFVFAYVSLWLRGYWIHTSQIQSFNLRTV